MAVLSLQARVEGALPGQAITFLLMGDATLENAVTPEAAAGREGVPAFSPMQAVYFAAGLGRPACHAAPSALVIQSPQGMEVALRINDLDVTIGSTIVVSTTTITLDGVDVPVMVVALVQGTATILLNGEQIALEQPSWEAPDALPVYAVTLNADGRVDADSVVVEPPLDAVAPVVAAACQDGLIMLGRAEDAAVCDAPLAPALVAPQTTLPAAADDPLAGVGAGAACQAAPSTTINRRGGPGTNYRAGGPAHGPGSRPPDRLRRGRGRLSLVAGRRWELGARRPGPHGRGLRGAGTGPHAGTARDHGCAPTRRR